MPDHMEYLLFDDGQPLPIQATNTTASGASPFSEEPQPVTNVPTAKLVQKVEDSIDVIRRFGMMAVQRLADLPKQPDKVTCKIAVKVTAGAGVMIASCSAEANFEIAIEWEKPENT